LQEVRVQTSVFAPEFGRTPGAQVSMTSRGGGNSLHGSAYEYFRNHHLNANDWFANEAGLPRGRMLQNQFGGTLGGPVIKSRTFFFSRLNRRCESQHLVASVPDMDYGQPPQRRAITTRFLSRTARAGRRSRVIRVVGDRNRAIVWRQVDRWAQEPASLGTATRRAAPRGRFTSPNVWSSQQVGSHTLWVRGSADPAKIKASSGNYSSSGGQSQVEWAFGGAVALTATVFQTGVDETTGSFNLSVLGLASYSLGARGSNEQKQINIVDGLSLTAGNHTYKLGADYRLNNSSTHNIPYSVMATFNGLASAEGSILSGNATMASVSSSRTDVYPSTTNYSFYVQDTWRSDSRLTITYGIRWDINPAPSVWKGLRPFAIAAANSNRVTQADPLYDTRWSDLSPRIGFAKQIGLVEGREYVLRGGFGIFHDPGYGTSMSAFGGAPYSNIRS
jgi:hypothetical protein